MDQKILVEIEAKLKDRKAELERELAKFATRQTDRGLEATFQDIGSDEEENALEVQNFSDQVSLVAELSKHLEDAEKALKKIKEGTYGICKYCKKEIDPKRLLVRPDSGSCVECKAALQGERS